MAKTEHPSVIKRRQEQRMNDLGYIKNPMAWHTMLCPLKRRNPDGGNDCAYLASSAPIIFHGNIYNPKETDRREQFESHEAILAAGWVVD